MVDFLIISTRSTKKGTEIFPKFRLYPKSRDLMIRGGDFYAVWIEERGLWSTNEDDALAIIDNELKNMRTISLINIPKNMLTFYILGIRALVL